MSRFDNQSVIVTGAGSGFGEAIAKRFAREGARVVVSDIDQDSGARVASEITADGGGALFIPADVSSDADVQALMEGTREAQERIDVLVNNAGYSHRQNLTWRITVEEFDAVFAVNVQFVSKGAEVRRSPLLNMPPPSLPAPLPVNWQPFSVGLLSWRL